MRRGQRPAPRPTAHERCPAQPPQAAPPPAAPTPSPRCRLPGRYNEGTHRRSIANQYHEVMDAASYRWLGVFSRVVVIISLVDGAAGGSWCGVVRAVLRAGPATQSASGAPLTAA